MGLAERPVKSGQGGRRTEGRFPGLREEEGALQPRSRRTGLGRARASSSGAGPAGWVCGQMLRYRR